MTTIINYKGYLACDSRYGYSEEGQLLTDFSEKIFINNDIILAAAGSGGECDAFMREDFSFLDWNNPVFPKSWVKKYLKFISVLMYRKGESNFLLVSGTRFPDPVPFDKEPIAIGSGADFAKAAAYALENNPKKTKYSPRQIAISCVETACKFDLNSGGQVKVFNIHKFKNNPWNNKSED